ncbi:MAG: DUF4363 family protein [Clostridia bacterium]|nr:DUF4363 family protein [Clostridia bacterium]
MRFKGWVISVSLLTVLALGSFSLIHVGHVSEVMLVGLDEVRTFVSHGDWQRAEARANTLHEDWHRRRAWLQLFISHRDTDMVDMTLVRLIATLSIEDPLGAALEIADADTSLRNLPSRETPAIHNVL